MKKPLSDDKYCFACGPLNPIGLHMEVSYGDNKAFSRLAVKKEFQGWQDMVHGGVLATLLDEIMAHAVIHHVGHGVTTSLQITYRAPLHVGEEIEVVGFVAEKNRRMAVARGEISVPESRQVIATAESKFLLAKKNSA